jgi:hypothetical protein
MQQLQWEDALDKSSKPVKMIKTHFHRNLFNNQVMQIVEHGSIMAARVSIPMYDSQISISDIDPKHLTRQVLVRSTLFVHFSYCNLQDKVPTAQRGIRIIASRRR